MRRRLAAVRRAARLQNLAAGGFVMVLPEALRCDRSRYETLPDETLADAVRSGLDDLGAFAPPVVR